MAMTLDNIKEAIVREGDVIYLMDILDIPMERLVELLSDEIADKMEVFEEEFGLEEDEYEY